MERTPPKTTLTVTALMYLDIFYSISVTKNH